MLIIAFVGGYAGGITRKDTLPIPLPIVVISTAFAVFICLLIGFPKGGSAETYTVRTDRIRLPNFSLDLSDVRSMSVTTEKSFLFLHPDSVCVKVYSAENASDAIIAIGAK